MSEPASVGDDVYYGVALSLLRQSRPIEVATLLARYRTPDQVFAADPDDLGTVERVGSDLIDALRAPALHDRARRELEAVRRAELRLVALGSPEYPHRLAQIYDPPAVIYVRGKLQAREDAVAVVGSRRPSPYGVAVAERLAADLAGAGLTIVSGLARGIDAAAHRGALDAGGRTIAVLACGLDRTYPREHEPLAARIAESGAVVGELPLGTPPQARQFPARNRLISGLTLGTIVVEAAERSGSLITAHAALDQGRDVFAVPGPITAPTSAGTNLLIQSGAKLVRHAADVLAEYPALVIRARSSPEASDQRRAGGEADLSEADRRLYGALPEVDPVDLDGLAARTGSAPAALLDRLLALELQGLITRLPGLRFVRRLQTW